MAKERLEPISLHLEMQRSYMEYAMSVIVGRALPDARDGLKPVQRRILYAMHELGLSPDRQYRKCARVVGDVLGKYHPHGDQAVYDALVRLVQTFASRYPVLDGHGNFGSVDDDPAAAMRYTETRLAPISFEAILGEIAENTVDFAPNFDGSQQEPTVLPAQLPFLLLNGCSGIAVGMATNIPPHNLSEIVDGLIELVKNPKISDEKLLEIIPGPDFPTGGEVLIGSGVRETYLKGRGSIPMRGVAHIEETQPVKGKHKRNAIVITELPYQISKAGWIEKLADSVNDNKIIGVSDIRDESDREGMRVVVELRRDSDPQKILNILYQKTSLQTNFGAILLALVNGQPQQLSLRNLLKTFIEYRELTLIRRTNYALDKTKERLEILEGLIKALKNLKLVIELIQEANDAASAKAKLLVQLDITDKQADAVLSMPLRRLTALEQTSLKDELIELKEKKSRLKELLENRTKLLKELIKEFKSIKKRFNDPRRTKLIEGGDELVAQKIANQRPSTELQIEQAYSSLAKDNKLLIQQDLQVKIISPQLLGKLQLEKECSLGEEIPPANLIITIEKKPKVLAVTESGRVALVRWEFAGQQPGNINKFLPTTLQKDEIITLLTIKNDINQTIGLLSSDGRFKRLAVKEILDLSGRASTIVKLKDDVKLKSAIICDPKGEVIILTSIGRIIKLDVNEEDLPVMGKLAQGPIITKLFPGEEIVGSFFNGYQNNRSIIIGTNKGAICKLSINAISKVKKGSFGQIVNILKEKSQEKVILISGSEGLLGIGTTEKRYGRIDGGRLDSSDPNHLKIFKLNLKDSEEIIEIKEIIKDED